MFINASAIKAYCKVNGRRCGKEFLEQVNRAVASRLEYAVHIKNGGKITLDRAVACYVGFKKTKSDQKGDING